MDTRYFELKHADMTEFEQRLDHVVGSCKAR